MAPRSVDLVAGGAPPVDLYDPTAPAWALAVGFRTEGWSVRVLYPAGPGGGPPPDGIPATAVPIALKRPGAPEEPAEFARGAGRLVREDAELVVRDPCGLGSVGLGRGPRRPRLAALVHALELATYDRERAGRSASGFVDRLDAWRDRRLVRRLERLALLEADRLFCDGPELAAALAREYGMSGSRVRELVPPVASPPTIPPRDQARGALGFPTDVPVVAALASVPDATAAGIDRVREAFRRVRPLFPGARMVIAGAASPPEPGVTVTPQRDLATFAQAISAADFSVLARRYPGFDPGAILSLRLSVPAVLLPGVLLPVDPKGSVRRLETDDAGDLASALADLIADPAARHALAEPGKAYADRFLPERVAHEIAESVGRA
jgi:hypothetical protein